MVKRYRHNSKKKTLAILAVVAVIVIGGAFVWAKHTRNTQPVGIATHSSPADNNFNNTRKKSSSPAKTLDNGPTAPSTSSNPKASLTVTRAGVVDGSLQVGTLVNNATSGTCTLSVSQTGQTTITASNQVALQNNSYSCPVFSIPLSQFPNQGNWNVSVTLTSGSSVVTSAWANNPVNLASAL